ncbi:ABC transporter substrate-binding protein [Neptunitalea lumnitzerae]|nr:ABC transporter substrate-binding protein [Neptunitalea sp. Y10]
MKNIKATFLSVSIALSLLFLTVSCSEKTKKEVTPAVSQTIEVTYAKGFTVENKDTYTLITVTKPWPNADRTFTYALIPKGTPTPTGEFDAVVQTPVENLVVTSTTHIPSLEALAVENTLVGFPDTQYVSSPKTRARIDNGLVKELGINESINTETVIDLDPDVVIGFSINNQNKTYATLQKTGIPVVYNGDWAEETPLGKAEWIKFFAPFFNKEKEADSIFSHIVTEYNNAKQLAAASNTKPTVVSGAMYRDVWYLPGGRSWMAQFLADANTQYLWSDNNDTGSLSLNFETVYDKAINADFWLAPGQFTAYSQLLDESASYKNFKAFKNKNIYTFSNTKGATGGLLYYELAPSRPDLVLKDLIYFTHPNVLTNYTPQFFKPLE